MSSLHMLWSTGFSPFSMRAADTKDTCALSALMVGCAVMLRRKDLPAWGRGALSSLSVIGATTASSMPGASCFGIPSYAGWADACWPCTTGQTRNERDQFSCGGSEAGELPVINRSTAEHARLSSSHPLLCQLKQPLQTAYPTKEHCSRLFEGSSGRSIPFSSSHRLFLALPLCLLAVPLRIGPIIDYEQCRKSLPYCCAYTRGGLAPGGAGRPPWTSGCFGCIILSSRRKKATFRRTLPITLNLRSWMLGKVLMKRP